MWPVVYGRSVVPLTVVRSPLSSGLILRCQGDLTLPTVESLRRELLLVTSLGQPSLLINLDAVRQIDTAGLLTLLEAHREMEAAGGRLILIAGREPVAGSLRRLGVDQELPICATEAEAITLAQGRARADGENRST